MQSTYQIATPYLRMLLQADDALTAALPESLIAEIESALTRDYVAGDLVNRAFEAVADLGLASWITHYGSQLGVGSHGAPGFAALSAPNLKTALEVFVQHAQIRNSGTTATLEFSQDRLDYVLVDLTGHELAGRWLIESNFLVAQQLIETIMAHPLGTNTWFDFACARQPHHRDVETLLHAQCRFGQADYRLSIPASWANMPSPLSDEDTFRANLAKSRELKMMLSRDRSDVAHLVNTLLRSHFDRRLSNTAIHPDIPSLERLANELAMSKRTLIRKLSKQGTSYKGILEAIRHELAEMLLKTTHLTAAEIAFKLGYHEAANFGRAFRRWTGISPAAWRRQESHS